MSFWRPLWRGLQVLSNRIAVDRDLDEEVSHYREELAASLEATGVSREEAQRAARIDTGSTLNVREQVRDAGWERWVTGTIDDVRYAVRRIKRSPALACTAGLTLALGIGATSAIFAVMDGVLWKPLPYPDSERLVALSHTAPGINLSNLRMSPSLYFTYREESRVLEDIAIWNGNRATVTGRGAPEEVPTLFVTTSFLNVLGVRPAIGRNFTQTDGNWQAPPTVLLSDAYWKQLFEADVSALGKRLLVNGVAHEVIGVLPASFEFLDEKVSLIVPRQLRREEVQLIQFNEDGIAKLRPGITLEQANADIARCLTLAPLKFPLNSGFTASAFVDARIALRLRFLKDQLLGDIAESLWIVFGAVGLLLLVACANVANLLLVRTGGRQQELAVRDALGAGWGRIARDILAESILLAMIGGALGLAFCFCALQWAASAAVADLPRFTSVAIDARTLNFTLITSIAAGILFGMIPAWRYGLRSTHNGLRGAGSRSMTPSRERNATQGALLATQVALATVLLVGSGLMLRTFQALRNANPGFTHSREVQIVRVSIPPTQIASPEHVFQMEESILRTFSDLVGVSGVAITTSAPMQGGSRNPVYSADHDPGEGKLPPVRNMRSVSPGFASVLGSQMVAGRDFTWHDLHSKRPVALISENMARELWGSSRAALGKQIRESLDEEWSEVIGVVADLRDDGVYKDAPAIVYWPLVQKAHDGSARVSRNIDLMIRSRRAGSAQFVQELQQALQRVNPDIPIANARTLDAIYAKSMARTTLVSVLLSVAGGMALLLGIVGVYGVTAYSVIQRRKEIAIRIALGSTGHAVTGMFVMQGLVLAAAGAALGTIASLWVTRLMQSLLFGVSSFDGVTYGSIVLVLVFSVLVASWLPARRASSVDAMKTLRAE